MNRIKRTFIQKAVIAPLVIGAVTAVLFFSMLPIVSVLIPVSKQNIVMADFEQGLQEIAIDYSSVKTDGELKKADALLYESNKATGLINVNGKEIPLVYNADNSVLSGAISILPEGNYIGEIGCAYAYGFKSVLDIASFQVGQNVEVKTNYGSYVFSVSNIRTVPSEQSIYSMNTGVKRGLVLYTNTNNGFGVSSSFSAVVLEMKSGPLVNQ